MKSPLLPTLLLALVLLPGCGPLATAPADAPVWEARPTLVRTPRPLRLPTITVPPAEAEGAGEEDPGSSGEVAILAAFEAGASNVQVEGQGTVARLLSDDNEGSRHQRFILRLRSGHTLLISHNIDVAPRVPLAEGDTVAFRGEYEWNEQGGILHWTHHDPQNRHEGGWLRVAGEVYE